MQPQMTQIEIFPSEWQHKKEIVESRINIKETHDQSKIKKIHARECKAYIISPKQSSEFINQHHIQGSSGARIHLGLFHLMQLVCVMTFGKPRFNKHYEWELIRLVTKKNTIVNGGASKLFKYFIRHYNPKNIISYCDKRWNNGTVYEKIGMKLEHVSTPCYWYIEPDGNITHRSHFQRHRLEKIFKQTFDIKMTEIEIMTKMGYKRWFDQGCKVFVWEKTN